MRFFGRTVRADGHPRASFHGTIHSDVRLFDEGRSVEGCIKLRALPLRNPSRVGANKARSYPALPAKQATLG